MIASAIKIIGSSKNVLSVNKDYFQAKLVNIINARFIANSIQDIHDVLVACLDASNGENERLRTIIAVPTTHPIDNLLRDGFTKFFSLAKNFLVCITELEKKGQITHAMLDQWINDLESIMEMIIKDQIIGKDETLDSGESADLSTVYEMNTVVSETESDTLKEHAKLEKAMKIVDENLVTATGANTLAINSDDKFTFSFIATSLELIHDLLAACLYASNDHGARLRTFINASASQPPKLVLMHGLYTTSKLAMNFLDNILILKKYNRITDAMYEYWKTDIETVIELIIEVHRQEMKTRVVIPSNGVNQELKNNTSDLIIPGSADISNNGMKLDRYLEINMRRALLIVDTSLSAIKGKVLDFRSTPSSEVSMIWLVMILKEIETCLYPMIGAELHLPWIPNTVECGLCDHLINGFQLIVNNVKKCHEALETKFQDMSSLIESLNEIISIFINSMKCVSSSTGAQSQITVKLVNIIDRHPEKVMEDSYPENKTQNIPENIEADSDLSIKSLTVEMNAISKSIEIHPLSIARDDNIIHERIKNRTQESFAIPTAQKPLPGFIRNIASVWVDKPMLEDALGCLISRSGKLITWSWYAPIEESLQDYLLHSFLHPHLANRDPGLIQNKKECDLFVHKMAFKYNRSASLDGYSTLKCSKEKLSKASNIIIKTGHNQVLQTTVDTRSVGFDIIPDPDPLNRSARLENLVEQKSSLHLITTEYRKLLHENPEELKGMILASRKEASFNTPSRSDRLNSMFTEYSDDDSRNNTSNFDPINETSTKPESSRIVRIKKPKPNPSMKRCNRLLSINKHEISIQVDVEEQVRSQVIKEKETRIRQLIKYPQRICKKVYKKIKKLFK